MYFYTSTILLYLIGNYMYNTPLSNNIACGKNLNANEEVANSYILAL